MKKNVQMLSESSDSYVVLNRRLLTQLYFNVVVVHDLEADFVWTWVRNERDWLIQEGKLTFKQEFTVSEDVACSHYDLQLRVKMT